MGVRHTAADDEGVDLAEQVVDDVQLIRDLRAAEDGDERTGGIGQRLAHHRDLFLDQVAADGGQVLRHAGGRGVRAVHGAEGVGNVHVGKRGEFLDEGIVVLLFTRIEPGVFKQDDLSVFQRGGFRLRVGTDRVGGERDLHAEQFGEPDGDGGQTVFRVDLPLRLAHMGAEDDLRALTHQVLDGGKRLDDPLVRGDDPVLLRDVEVAADEHALALDVNVFNGFLVVGCHFRISFSDIELGFSKHSIIIYHIPGKSSRGRRKIVKKKTKPGRRAKKERGSGAISGGTIDFFPEAWYNKA